MSAIESASKGLTVATLQRLLSAAGAQLILAADEATELASRARAFEQAIELAEALPFRRTGGLHFPRVPNRSVTTAA